MLRSIALELWGLCSPVHGSRWHLILSTTQRASLQPFQKQNGQEQLNHVRYDNSIVDCHLKHKRRRIQAALLAGVARVKEKVKGIFDTSHAKRKLRRKRSGNSKIFLSPCKDVISVVDDVGPRAGSAPASCERPENRRLTSLHALMCNNMLRHATKS